MEKGNKEMDLFELINRGINLFRTIIIKCWNFLLSLIKFHFKNIIIILPFLIIGVSLSVYKSMKENRKQFAEFMLQINGNTDSYEVSDIIRVLGQTINPDTGNVVFAQTLKIDNYVVKKVYALNPFFVIDLNNNKTRDYVDYGNSFREDTLNSRMGNFLSVRIYAKGVTNFQEIQQKIVDYLIRNPYLIGVEQERIKSLQERIQALDIEIMALDSLRKEQLRNKNNLALQLDKSSVILGEESSYYKEMIEIKNQKNNLQAKLILQPNVVSVYSGVTVQADKSTISIFVKNVGLLYAFGLFLAFIVYYRKRIKALLKD
ncbi:MAG: hypothetical protein P4L28_02365 [Paludibacteraceae bacterium]|nr:hypothetical protein [Paludibacteraceae bacterium]